MPTGMKACGVDKSMFVERNQPRRQTRGFVLDDQPWIRVMNPLTCGRANAIGADTTATAQSSAFRILSSFLHPKRNKTEHMPRVGIAVAVRQQ
jgi:hypothetical protein